ncbi:fungal specific transcription factor domain-containing protein [Aspergillus tanneri]|uniref:Transcription factor domain-containing protein n=1 Tax=Aspergillus tanneri TaxID=1220188 RepID=A0A5M9N3Y5_9EURO|nr:uncharacterized protein ATNIH1004_001334 [Aspergillus tanneri]KAA8652430.1 hypothetical protein ATNIH1004_001334 [Aspergillus tanneri]
MPPPGEGTRSHRKGYYSCDFAGHAGSDVTARYRARTVYRVERRATLAPRPQQPPSSIPPHSTAPSLVSPAGSSDQGQLLEELQSLRRLVTDSERCVVQTTNHRSHGGDIQSTSSAQAHVDLRGSPGLDQVKEMVAQLERVSMVQSSREPIYVDDLVFKVEHIRNIPRAPSFTVQGGKPARCVWLPLQDEARVILDKFITNVSYIHHVVHHPSLPATIDDFYRQIESRGPIKPGHLVLLLGIIASTTEVWSRHDDVETKGSIFPSALHANAQTPLWIKAAMDVLKSGQNGPALALEAVQGIILLSFVVCNTEGVSFRYRSLLSTGLLLSRELGLHRIDHESNAVTANTVPAEIGRRVWWYLVATDWLLAVIYDGPSEGVYLAHQRHMIVNKPRNINDIDLVDNGASAWQKSHGTSLTTAQWPRPALVGQATLRRSWEWTSNLIKFIHDIPSFFNLDNYENNPESTSTSIFVHAYLLNLVIHTQRCKLHLWYLTSGPNNNNPAYTTSRDICLESARQLTRAESQLERAQHPFVLIRFRLSAMLYGVFLASIALLMDAYINRSGSLQDEIRHGDVAEALHIVESARSHSWAAENLHQSLTQVLAKYRAQHPQQPSTQAPSTLLPMPSVSTATSTPVTNVATTRMAPSPDQLPPMLDQLPVPISQPPYSNQLAQSLEELMHADGFQWDDLFPGIHSASFF